jgi:uncharacterized protein YdeI (YjbR/CyaY-like superfamily)
MTDFSKLKRTIQEMPEDVLAELKAHNVVAQYHERPAYQQNDYLAWIVRAKKEETRVKRLRQMIEELKKGDRYMHMYWKKVS